MRLISRWQNSAGERVRIALHLKSLAFDYVPVSRLAPGDYLRLNPQGLLPALDVNGCIIAQSQAILAYLEEIAPEPSLLPGPALLRAEARAFAGLIASEMHALTVQRVRRFLGSDLSLAEPDIAHWTQHWLKTGFAALEASLARRSQAFPFCFGSEPGLADLHLIPQMAPARRLGSDLSLYPLLLGVESQCLRLDAFQRASPQEQPDYPGA